MFAAKGADRTGLAKITRLAHPLQENPATAIERLKNDEAGQAHELLRLLEAHLARLELRYV